MEKFSSIESGERYLKGETEVKVENSSSLFNEKWRAIFFIFINLTMATKVARGAQVPWQINGIDEVMPDADASSLHIL